MRLAGKVAIVTGAGRGIGRGIALRLAEEGSQVVVASRTAATVDEVVGLLRSRGHSAAGVTVDVGSREQVEGMVDAAVKQFGRLDILVNNAQSFGRPGEGTRGVGPQGVADLDEQVWDHIYQTGVKGTLYGMVSAFPGMRAQGSGRVINIYSPASQLARPGMAAYHCAKEAIRSLTRTAAREWAPFGITVNCLSPAILNDAVRAHLNAAEGDVEREERMQLIVQDIPVGRLGDAEADAGAAAAFLASGDASFITGVTLRVDGGLAI